MQMSAAAAYCRQWTGENWPFSTAHNLGHHVVEFLHAQSEAVDESAITYSVGFWSIAHPHRAQTMERDSGIRQLRDSRKSNGTAKKPLSHSLELGKIQRSFVPAKPRNDLE